MPMEIRRDIVINGNEMVGFKKPILKLFGLLWGVRGLRRVELQCVTITPAGKKDLAVFGKDIWEAAQRELGSGVEVEVNDRWY